MKAIKLLEKYPLSSKVIQDFYLEQLLDSFSDNVPMEFRESLKEKGVSLETIAVYIDSLPRGLFDVFDKNDLIIVILYHENTGFSYAIDETDKHENFSTRKEAEIEAITKAFGILEQKLTTLSCDNIDS